MKPDKRGEKLNINKELDMDIFARGYLSQELDCESIRCEVPRFSHNDHMDFVAIDRNGWIIALELKLKPDNTLIKQVVRNQKFVNESIGFVPCELSEKYMEKAKKAGACIFGIGENDFQRSAYTFKHFSYYS